LLYMYLKTASKTETGISSGFIHLHGKTQTAFDLFN
jgi:hypothetical protein